MENGVKYRPCFHITSDKFIDAGNNIYADMDWFSRGGHLIFNKYSNSLDK